MRLQPNASGSRLLREFNPNHEPAGSSKGGQFAAAAYAAEGPAQVSSREPAKSSPDPTGFRAWFEGSKVVDAAGAPKVVYHGTRYGFDTFEPAHSGTNSNVFGNWAVKRAGIFFTENPVEANAFAQQATDTGARVIPAYLSLANPVDTIRYNGLPDDAVEALGKLGLSRSYYTNLGPWSVWEAFDHENAGEKFVATLKSLGYDGLKMYGATGQVNWIAFEPGQVKSAYAQTFTHPTKFGEAARRPTYPNASTSKLTEFNPNHDPKNGEFAASKFGDRITRNTEPASAESRTLNAMAPKLTPTEAAVVSRYIEFQAFPMNRSLNAGRSDFAPKEVAVLDRAVRKARTAGPLTVYRSGPLGDWPGARNSLWVEPPPHEIGETVTHSGFVSTSLGHDAGYVGRKYRIDVPAGTHALPAVAAHPGGVDPQREVILPRGSRFTVLGYEGGVYHVRLVA